MSDHHHHDSGSGFLNGLILGAVIGAGIALLLGTKKGKELADEMSQKGLSLLDNFEDTFAEIEEDAQLPASASSQDAPSPLPKSMEEDKPASNGNGNGNGSSHPHIEALQTQGRRLFHGIPKRK